MQREEANLAYGRRECKVCILFYLALTVQKLKEFSFFTLYSNKPLLSSQNYEDLTADCIAVPQTGKLTPPAFN